MVSGVRGISRSVKPGKLLRYVFFVFTLFLFSSSLMFYGGFTPLQSVDAVVTTTTLRPDGDGTYHNWTGTPADSYDDWNDIAPDGDSSYFYVTHDDYSQSSTLQNTGATGLIQSVKVVIRARNNVTSDDLLRTMLVIGGERYLGRFTFAPTTSYVDYYGWYAKNPATDSDWTWTAINDLEAGVVSQQEGDTWSGEIRVTQLYVNVSTPKPTVYFSPANTTNLSLVPEATSPLILSPDSDGTYTTWSAYPPPAHESHPSTHTDSTGAVTNPDDAYDQDMGTYAEWNYETPRPAQGLKVETFGISTGTITAVDFKIKYTATAATDVGTYTIKYTSDGGSNWVTLVAATNVAHSVPGAGYDVWADQDPSQGGSWTWTYVGQIEISIETGTGRSKTGTGTIREYEAWVSVTIGGIDYTVWDEYPSHDGDSSYAYAGGAYLYETSTLEDHTSETWDIARVKVIVYAKANLISDDQLTILLRAGIYLYGATPIIGPTNETYTAYTAEWARNPSTGTFWTWSDIDGLEAGVAANFGQDNLWDSGLEMRVTQLYVEVAGPRLAVDIKVDNVTDLWLYQFDLTFNPDVLQGVRVHPGAPVAVGPFIGSAGGSVSPNPGVGFNNTLGKLDMTGAYIGELPQTPPAPPPPDVWPEGSGVLSTVFFHVIALGDSNLRLGEITSLMDPDGEWIARGREYVEDGYFRNVAWGDMPKVDFTKTGVGTPEPLEGYNTTFTSTTTGGTTPYTYKWYLWKIHGVELFYPIVTSTDTVTRNYTTRGYWNVTLTVIDDDDVVGTKRGYVRIKAHDIFFNAVTTNATRGQFPAVLSADMGDIVEVNATAINQGDYTETFDVSTFWSGVYGGEMHYGPIGTQTGITLAPGASQNVTFSWDTEGRNVTHPGQFAVHANASAVAYEYDRERAAGKIADNQFFGPAHRIRFRDIAVTNVVTNATGLTITPGVKVSIDVTVRNQGDFNQTSISVTAYYDNTAIDTQVVSVLTNQTFSAKDDPVEVNYTTTISFLWDTTDVGNVTIKAKATWTGWNTPDHAEEDYEPDDNTFTNGWIKAGAGAVPEFPLGAALEIALAILIIYVWSRSKRKIKPGKSVGFPTR